MWGQARGDLNFLRARNGGINYNTGYFHKDLLIKKVLKIDLKNFVETGLSKDRFKWTAARNDLITMGIEDNLALENPVDIGEVPERQRSPRQGNPYHDPEG